MKAQDNKTVPLFLTLAGLTLSLVVTQRASAASFVDASSMHNARTSHTATLLPTGKVLVAGGFSTSCELYDPAADIWTVTGSLHLARAGATAILLPNGKVLVAGGEARDGSFWDTTSAELYDPATATWTLTSPMKHSRYGLNAVLLPNGKVLVVGAKDGSLATELYDPATETWTEIDAPGGPAGNATLLPNGEVFCPFGTTAQFYDPVTGTWTTRSATFQSYYGGTLLHTGEVLCQDGTNAALYDFRSETWTPTGSTMLGAHTSTLLRDGKLLALSATGAELYDPTTGTWTSTASMRLGRYWHTVTLLTNGKVLVAGGSQTRTATAVDSAELYLPDSDGSAPSIKMLHHTDQILSFSWTGAGVLEQTDSFIAPDWQPAPSQDNPQILSTTDPMQFFRVKAD